MMAWVLGGPTASGKTVIAHALAEAMGAVILCADAMTVYRGLDIGTAKPDAALRARVPYYGLDLVDPDQTFSAGAFREEARRAAARAESEQRPLILVGGSGLYLSAALKGLDESPPPDPERRAYWEALWRREGIEGLQRELLRLDPAAFTALADPQNPRRLLRALERAEAGVPPPASWKKRPHRPKIAALRLSPEALRGRIRARAAAMFHGGLLEEARAARARWPQWSRTAQHAIGYAEAFEVLDGRLSLEEAIDRTTARTWQLARRQMTWLRTQLDTAWIDITEEMSAEQAGELVRRRWETDGPTPLHL